MQGFEKEPRNPSGECQEAFSALVLSPDYLPLVFLETISLILTRESVRMPISDEEWKAGKTMGTLEANILAFLKQNQKPFNIAEIISGLGYNTQIEEFGSFISGVASYWVFQKALDKWVNEGAVKARIIKNPFGEQTYYKAT